MVRALRRYLGAEGAEFLAAARGVKQVEAGDVYDMDEVLREAESIIGGKVA
jgi:predicted transcriptional regulator